DLDIEKDPPPDLIIEVNRTSSSLPRMPIFAAFNVKEVWRFDGKKVKFYTLEEGVYLEIEKSIALPVLSSRKATEFLRDSREMKSTAWLKKIRDWAKTENKSKENK
ncbi:MAG: Uma2 family endonuclease, partial [Acidobacteria bacterium]|nr:Uma2 family endonuclease [Acidobacteriota bacterium]